MEAGLHYNWHRHYDPTLGRYTQPDPLGFVDGPSVFSYAGNSPSQGVDKDGRWMGIPPNIPEPPSTKTCDDDKDDDPPLVQPANDVCSMLGKWNRYGLGGEIMAPCGMGGGGGASRGGSSPPTTVIGRTKDLKDSSKLGPNEQTLLDRLPNRGDPKSNWEQNSSVLRQIMRERLPIRDVSPGDTGGQFLNAERNLLRNNGWTFDAGTGYWNPPR
jgi:hypothetical protein